MMDSDFCEMTKTLAKHLTRVLNFKIYAVLGDQLT